MSGHLSTWASPNRAGWPKRPSPIRPKGDPSAPTPRKPAARAEREPAPPTLAPAVTGPMFSRQRTCLWPIWHSAETPLAGRPASAWEEGGARLFCGAPVADPRDGAHAPSYCAEHCARAFVRKRS